MFQMVQRLQANLMSRPPCAVNPITSGECCVSPRPAEVLYVITLTCRNYVANMSQGGIRLML